MQILKQSTAIKVRIGPFVDVTDGFTPETGITPGTVDEAELLKADGVATVDLSTATLAAITGCPGWYDLSLTASHTDTVGTLDVVFQDASVCLPVFARFQVVEEAVYDDIFGASAAGYLKPTTAGRTLDVTATGEAGIDLDNTAGTIAAAQLATDCITADKVAADVHAEAADVVWDEDATGHQTTGTFGQAIGDPVANTKTLYAALVTDAVGASVTADVATVQADTDDIQTRLPAALVGGRMDSDVGNMQAGTVDAAAIATDAIDADALAAGATDEIIGQVTGTADSGTTTTLVDADRTEADTDYWKGSVLLITSGNIAGQARRITAFTPGTDTITVDTAFTQPVSTHTYTILKTTYVEAAAAGSGDWTTAEKEQIRDALGVDGTKTAATGGDLQDVLTDTADMQPKLGTPAADLAADIAAIKADQGITLSGTANAGDTTTQITLTGGITTDNYYNGQLVVITGGTGAGQARTILDYTGIGTIAVPTRDWTVAPDGTSTFIVMAFDVPALLEAGIAQAGAAGSITLDATASAIDATYVNNHVMITGGTGLGQTRLIGTYNGSTKVAVVTPSWTTTPDSTSIYQILPAARVDVGGWLGNLVTGDGDWAQMIADIAAVQADTDDIQTRLPAALVGGKMDSDVGNIQADAVNAAAIANGAIDAATFAAGAIDAAAIATDAIDADALATDAVQEIADKVLPKKNTALNDIPFFMRDDTDHITPETGLATFTIQVSKDGAAFVGATGTTITELGNGWYAFDAPTDDMNATAVVFRFSHAGADDTYVPIRTGG